VFRLPPAKLALKRFHIWPKLTRGRGSGNRRARRRKSCAARFRRATSTPRTFVAVGQIAKDAKNTADASYFSRAAVNAFGSSIEVAQAQFDLAWEAHDAKNFAESSRMLTEHLAYYADKNTDNRGTSRLLGRARFGAGRQDGRGPRVVRGDDGALRRKLVRLSRQAASRRPD
jgi:hypothetical protein